MSGQRPVQPGPLFTWLAAEPAGWTGRLRIVAQAVPLMAIPGGVQTLLLRAAGVSYTDLAGADRANMINTYRGPVGWGQLMAWLVVTVAAEELFRVVPLGLTVHWRRTPRAVTVAALVSSAVFAFGHAVSTLDLASLSSGLTYLWSRGTVGLILAAVYLKCGGWHRRPLRGFTAATTAHCLYDAILITVIFWRG